ncbi:MAG: ATPase P [Peptococcaceae bacterium]|jgi:soluble P-type ATPase|nr:ATPase P [Peptococcaceae bacterium]
MIKVNIPGKGSVVYTHIVLDFNGTISCDGVLIPGVEDRLNRLAENLEVHILTADTFGLCRKSCQGIRGTITILTSETGAPVKEKFIEELGADKVIALGNGTNDALMLARSGLGIVVTGPEGTSAKALLAADIVARDINVALDLLLNTQRLVATLRA